MKPPKKLLPVIVIIILLTIALLYSACTHNPATRINTDPSTSSTPVTTNPTSSSSPTQPTDPPPTELDPNALTADEIAELQNIYQLLKNENGSRIPNFYNTALGLAFTDPRDISLAYFFCSGDQEEFENTRMTDEEYEFIKSVISYAEALDLYRISAQDVERILQMCFGLSLADMNSSDLEHLPYWEKTDCYYSGTTSPAPYAFNLKIIGGTHLENGTLQVFYTTDEDPVTQWVMILKPVDGGYHILSNLEVK